METPDLNVSPLQGPVTPDPSITEVTGTITKMGYPGELRVTVITPDQDETMVVVLWRTGGCGKLYRNVCNYLRNKFLDSQIILLENPKPGNYCATARVRDSGTRCFRRQSVQVSPHLLDY